MLAVSAFSVLVRPTYLQLSTKEQKDIFPDCFPQRLHISKCDSRGVSHFPQCFVRFKCNWAFKRQKWGTTLAHSVCVSREEDWTMRIFVRQEEAVFRPPRPSESVTYKAMHKVKTHSTLFLHPEHTIRHVIPPNIFFWVSIKDLSVLQGWVITNTCCFSKL